MIVMPGLTHAEPRTHYHAQMQQLLMIEDDARLAQMVGEYLTQSGFGVTHAIDGASRPGALLQRHARPTW